MLYFVGKRSSKVNKNIAEVENMTSFLEGSSNRDCHIFLIFINYLLDKISKTVYNVRGTTNKTLERNTKMIEDLLKFITVDVVLLLFLLHVFLPYLKDCVRCRLSLGIILAVACSSLTCILLFHFLLFTICIPIYGGFDNACKVLCSEKSH